MLRAVEEQQEAGVAVGFVGGVVVDAAGMGGGDVASGYATLCQFTGDVVGTREAETVDEVPVALSAAPMTRTDRP